jgi:hypothetical protein
MVSFQLRCLCCSGVRFFLWHHLDTCTKKTNGIKLGKRHVEKNFT